VRIDIPWLNENLRDRLNQTAPPSVASAMLSALSSVAEKDEQAPASKLFFGNYHWFAEWGARFAPLANAVNRTKAARWAMERCFGLDRRRALPPFPSATLVRAAQDLPGNDATEPLATVALFADTFTNYGMVQRGVAAVRLLRALGVDLVVSDSVPEGRAALSQGLLATAKEYASRAASLLDHFLDEGRDIVVLEPSSLAMFRRDARHLLENETQFERLRTRSFEPVEYIANLLSRSGRHPKDVFDVQRSPVGSRVFYHSHCQQKTIGCAAQTETLLREIGFDVATSSVECCGMAGSFGYKKDYYDLSMAVGEDLFQQVKKAEEGVEPRALLASGTSCTEQFHAGLHRHAMHPVELLAVIFRGY